MRINQITEAKYAKPVQAFHGTTSKFLQPILKQGLIPNPKKKKWDTDKQATSYRHSRISLTGSYWTTNLYTMISSANNTKDKFGGNPLYIIANIQLGSTKADEDKIIGSFERIYNQSLLQFTNPEFTHLIAELLTKNKKAYNKAKQLFIKNFHNDSTKNTNKPIPTKMLSNAFNANTIRKFAYDINLVKFVENLPNIPTPEQAEQYLNTVKEQITSYYTESVNYTFNQTFRVTTPITYRGNNRITHVIENLSKPDFSQKILKIHYGNENTIPPEFIQHFGENLEITA